MVVIGHVVWSIMGDQGFIIIFSLNGLILEDWKKKALLYILLQFIHKIIISLRYTYKIYNFYASDSDSLSELGFRILCIK